MDGSRRISLSVRRLAPAASPAGAARATASCGRTPGGAKETPALAPVCASTTREGAEGRLQRGYDDGGGLGGLKLGPDGRRGALCGGDRGSQRQPGLLVYRVPTACSRCSSCTGGPTGRTRTPGRGRSPKGRGGGGGGPAGGRALVQGGDGLRCGARRFSVVARDAAQRQGGARVGGGGTDRRRSRQHVQHGWRRAPGGRRSSPGWTAFFSIAETRDRILPGRRCWMSWSGGWA